jgi:hypothetical protein
VPNELNRGTVDRENGQNRNSYAVDTWMDGWMDEWMDEISTATQIDGCLFLK